MSLPPLQPLSARISAAPQLEPAAMALVAQAGFKSVINNRPDHEGGADQPTSAAIEAAALAAGLSYRHLPVAPVSATMACTCAVISSALRRCGR